MRLRLGYPNRGRFSLGCGTSPDPTKRPGVFDKRGRSHATARSRRYWDVVSHRAASHSARRSRHQQRNLLDSGVLGTKSNGSACACPSPGNRGFVNGAGTKHAATGSSCAKLPTVSARSTRPSMCGDLACGGDSLEVPGELADCSTHIPGPVELESDALLSHRRSCQPSEEALGRVDHLPLRAPTR